MKLNKLCEEWLETYQKDRVKIQTYVRYRCIINNCIRDSIGKKDIRRLNKRTIQDYITSLKRRTSPRTGKKLSTSTVNMCLTVLKMLFAYAVDCGLLKSDPTANVRGFSTKSNTGVKCFTIEEQIKIENYILQLNNDEWLGIVLDLYTGLRIGELLALRWEDVDFETGVLSVNKTVFTTTDGKGRWYTTLGTPKTSTSNREIPLSDHVLAMLEDVKSRSKSLYVVSRNNGEMMNQRLYRWRFNKMLDELGIRRLTFHALRHTFATRAIESGMDVKTLSEILGHTNASVTLNVYAHSMSAHKRQMMNQLTGVLLRERGSDRLVGFES